MRFILIVKIWVNIRFIFIVDIWILPFLSSLSVHVAHDFPSPEILDRRPST